jgi:hypothetical protein
MAGRSSALIFPTTKAMLNVAADDTSFDVEIVAYMNVAMTSLYQLGLTQTPFVITTKEETYGDLVPVGLEKFGQLEAYIALKTRLFFDPPHEALYKAIETQLGLMESRFLFELETGSKLNPMEVNA